MNLKKKQQTDAIYSKIILESFKQLDTSSLKSWEHPRGIVISKEEWTEENGCVTYSQKLCRRVIAQRNQEAINQLFNDIDAVDTLQVIIINWPCSNLLCSLKEITRLVMK